MTETYDLGDFLRDWSTLAGDIAALKGRLSQLDVWVASFVTQFASNEGTEDTMRWSSILLENQLGTVAEEASRIAKSAKELRGKSGGSSLGGRMK
ncbi:MAG: hypothetical protein HYX87_06915 [Chloroflexi bacterium]|nr:hypothetical protein [Chloroflexota bacterium]